jgi:hypothetical protein
MSDLNDRQSSEAADERRTELRVPASTLGSVTSRLIGGSDLELLNYTSRSLCGQAASRLLIGSRISVRVVTATLDAVLAGRVVRSNLTQIVGGVPRYEVVVALDSEVDWAPPDTVDALPVDDAVPVREPESRYQN